MGDAVTHNMPLSRGTVLANFNRSTGIYENLSEGNHTLIFLELTKTGMVVIEQATRWSPYVHEIPLQSSKYWENAVGFNVVRIKVYVREERVY